MSRREFPFTPKGKTSLLVAASSAPTGVLVESDSVDATIVFDCYTIWNSGSDNVFLGYGKTAGAAQSNSVIPTAGTPQSVVVIPAGSVAVLRFLPDTYFSGITASGSSDVFITVGEGL